MLPPIYKSTNGLPNDRRGSGVSATYFGDNNRKQSAALGLPSPSRVVYPEPQNNGMMSGDSPTRMADRVHALERDNAHFREELMHLRQVYSNNQIQHGNEKISVSNVFEDLQRLAQSFNSKLQADMNHQQREQQKAALLFAEIARLGHRVEGLEGELRTVVEDIHRKFEAQDQHVQFMASIASKQQPQQAVSPGRNAELQRQLRDTQDAIVQLRGELDADRNARWKNDAAVDAKLDAQIERLTTKLIADKRDMARVLDEQRQLMTGADFQRVTAHMREFSRVNDHLLALERWLHSEFGQVKRIFQTMAGDVDARFQFVLVELANGLKAWHAAQARQEDELGMRVRDLEDATRAVALAVQRKLRALEEVVPLEVQARQKNDDKIRRRMESVVKALGHAIETSREEMLPHQVMLVHRVHQLELAQHRGSEQVEGQHNAMRETIQTFMKDSDAMLARLADTIEQERGQGVQVVAEPVVAPVISPVIAPAIAHVSALVSPPTQANDEIRAETKRIKEELDALQVWSAKHAQECRQFFDFLNWSMEDSRREIVVMQCLDDVIDQIVEAHALEKICAVEKNVSGALRQIEQVRTRAASPPMAAALQTAFDQETDFVPASLASSCAHLETPEGSQLADSNADSREESNRPFSSSFLPDKREIETDPEVMIADQMNQLVAALETEEQLRLGETLSDAPAYEAAAADEQRLNDEDDGDGYNSMDTTEYSVDFEQNSSAHTKLLMQQVKLREGSDDYHDDRDFIEEANEPPQPPLEPALQPVNDDLGLEEPSILDL